MTNFLKPFVKKSNLSVVVCCKHNFGDTTMLACVMIILLLCEIFQNQ